MVRHSPQKKGIGAGRFSGREKKPVQVGSFRGPLAAATQHAEAAVSRLKGRAKKRAPIAYQLGMTSNPVCVR
jgi:hypothetical protein